MTKHCKIVVFDLDETLGCLDSEGTPHSRGSVLMFLPGKFYLVRNLLF